ncbi:RNA-binding S4 domain-containing protein [Arachidicoccus ginsenosidivorans]|uniref:RNA-binding S4 domain-containing protein n=1 Tax=Arachidicoccus ginsenosidivorans TaxID=496057 RepID=UPI001CEF9ADE|nr:RNA-binding S4 domain-containing protein [Arachidicoccus ginsenosidivorans]
MDEKLRIDKYLWAIRLFKTRSQAADGCDKGKVKLHGQNVKAAKAVNIGDVYEVKTEARKWVIEVTGLLPKRVAYAEAIKFYKDITPPEALDQVTFQALVFIRVKGSVRWGGPPKETGAISTIFWMGRRIQSSRHKLRAGDFGF